jgi:hypothetical protein
MTISNNVSTYSFSSMAAVLLECFLPQHPLPCRHVIYLRLAGLQVVSVVVVVVLLLLGGGGGETYQQNSVLRRDRDFLYKIPNEANIKCQLWYFIQWFKILPLGGVRPKFAKLGQFLEKSLLNKTFREH